MGGLYDILESYRFQDPKYTYEGLYQDPMSKLATANPFKAIFNPDFEYRSPSFIERRAKSGATNPQGFVPIDYDRAVDFKRLFEDRPLKPTDGVARFEGFDPRVGTITPFEPSAPFDPMYFQGAYPTNIPTGIMTQTQIPERFKGITEETDIDDDTKDVVEEEKSNGILDLIGMFIPGFNALRNFDSQPYERFDRRASIKDGIYSIGSFNQPASMVNDFYNPRTGLNRFDRAAERYRRTGSVKDLFASSRTGAEFFRRLRERKAAKQKALEDAAKAKSGDGGDSPQIQDRPAITGIGDFATFDTSGKDYGPFSR
tara:strand:- start:68 stop:1009 length:942 start_codon:yes stop_codon:yes gene_type:complete